ncbi:MAG: glycosyltransferase family 2 protein [Cyclobacteriaceae bacterium]
MILISIITPVKNYQAYLEDMLKSVIGQSYQHWELLLVDDHSTDLSHKIMTRWAAKDSRIKVFQNPETGIVPALQHALENATGSLITRMDADDLMPPEKLVLLSEALLNQPDKTIATGLVKYFGDKPISQGYLDYENWLNETNLRAVQWIKVYRECVIASPNWMMHTSDLKAMGGFKALIYPEDYDLTLKWYRSDFTIQVVPKITHLWREHPERTSRTSDHYDQAHFFDLKIRAFANFDWNGQTVIVWGKNQKSKLTTAKLDSQSIEHQVMGLSDFETVKDFPNRQILVAVYPEKKHRNSLESFLNEIGRKEGTDWWYL